MLSGNLGIRRWSMAIFIVGWLGLPTVQGATQSNEQTFQVTASKFKFTPSRVEVALGARVRLTMSSEDVDHGFSLPDFNVEAEIPSGGETVTIEFIADKVGVFPFECSTFCGEGHFDMKGELVVLSPDGGSGVNMVEANRVETDFTIVTLPTTRRLPARKFAFRVTHRFARPLGQGDFGNLAEDLFGLDGGAQIGLELRYGLTPSTQVAFYRTSNRTIALSGQQGLVQQGNSPVGVGFVVAVEGTDNLQGETSPSVGLVVSRRLGTRIGLYLVPQWVGNTNLADIPGDESTFVLGFGGRLFLTESVALTAEASPRVSGFDDRMFGGSTDFQASFGIEKIYGGHVFQLNFSNDLGTTPAQVARGLQGPDDWFIGFNISRKFF